MNANREAIDFARRITDLGFHVYVAKDGTGRYGFITDDTKARVLSFSFEDGSSLSGNYGPPSQSSGTGWRMEGHPSGLRTAGDVRAALYAMPPLWVGNGWKQLTTVAAYLALYGTSSRFAEFTGDAS